MDTPHPSDIVVYTVMTDITFVPVKPAPYHSATVGASGSLYLSRCIAVLNGSALHHIAYDTADSTVAPALGACDGHIGIAIPDGRVVHTPGDSSMGVDIVASPSRGVDIQRSVDVYLLDKTVVTSAIAQI